MPVNDEIIRECIQQALEESHIANIDATNHVATLKFLEGKTIVGLTPRKGIAALNHFYRIDERGIASIFIYVNVSNDMHVTMDRSYDSPGIWGLLPPQSLELLHRDYMKGQLIEQPFIYDDEIIDCIERHREPALTATLPRLINS